MFRRRSSQRTACACKANRSRLQLLERLEDQVCLSATPIWAEELKVVAALTQIEEQKR